MLSEFSDKHQQIANFIVCEVQLYLRKEILFFSRPADLVKNFQVGYSCVYLIAAKCLSESELQIWKDGRHIKDRKKAAQIVKLLKNGIEKIKTGEINRLPAGGAIVKEFHINYPYLCKVIDLCFDENEKKFWDQEFVKQLWEETGVKPDKKKNRYCLNGIVVGQIAREALDSYTCGKIDHLPTLKELAANSALMSKLSCERIRQLLEKELNEEELAQWHARQKNLIKTRSAQIFQQMENEVAMFWQGQRDRISTTLEIAKKLKLNNSYSFPKGPDLRNSMLSLQRNGTLVKARVLIYAVMAEINAYKNGEVSRLSDNAVFAKIGNISQQRVSNFTHRFLPAEIYSFRVEIMQKQGNPYFRMETNRGLSRKIDDFVMEQLAIYDTRPSHQLPTIREIANDFQVKMTSVGTLLCRKCVNFATKSRKRYREIIKVQRKKN